MQAGSINPLLTLGRWDEALATAETVIADEHLTTLQLVVVELVPAAGALVRAGRCRAGARSSSPGSPTRPTPRTCRTGLPSRACSRPSPGPRADPRRRWTWPGVALASHETLGLIARAPIEGLIESLEAAFALRRPGGDRRAPGVRDHPLGGRPVRPAGRATAAVHRPTELGPGRGRQGCHDVRRRSRPRSRRPATSSGRRPSGSRPPSTTSSTADRPRPPVCSPRPARCSSSSARGPASARAEPGRGARGRGGADRLTPVTPARRPRPVPDEAAPAARAGGSARWPPHRAPAGPPGPGRAGGSGGRPPVPARCPRSG